MDFKKFSRDYASEINGQYTEYSETTSLFTVPLPDGRYQMVVAEIKKHPRYNKDIVHVTSQVCSAKDKNIKFVDLLESVKGYIHSRFIVDGDFLRTEASYFLENADKNIIKEMINEVANVADQWEFKITGKDIH